MATEQSSLTTPPESPGDAYRQATQTVESEAILELLGDEYARRVLRAIAGGPRTGRELVDTTDMSKATVYRRLNRLEEAGLVETTRRIDPDGHHRKQFRAVVTAIDFEFGGDGLSVSVRTDGGSGNPTAAAFDGEGTVLQSSD